MVDAVDGVAGHANFADSQEPPALSTAGPQDERSPAAALDGFDPRFEVVMTRFVDVDDR